MKTLLFLIAGTMLCMAPDPQLKPKLEDLSIPKIPKIIFDTDIGPDYDDVGAIAMLHALADKGECEILATVSSNGNSTIAPTIELYNRYFGRDKLPVGIPNSEAPNFTNKNGWNEKHIKHFAPDLAKKKYPSAVSVYRKTLAAQPDNSVTILTVGFLSNVSELLDSQPDEHSKLSGVDLVKKKVKNLVAMAGRFPEGKESNAFLHTKASINTFTRWPKPILFSGWEIGINIYTGDKVAKGDITSNPVASAFDYGLKHYTSGGETKHESFDQTAVLIAIRDPSKYFYVNGPGKLIMNNDSTDTWDPKVDAGHYFISHKYPYNYIADTIEDLMLHKPKR
jgi:inosine-uridine nucleoside N-ribohydrolase